MGIRDTADRYGPIAILNHWVSVVLVIALVCTGLFAAELAGDETRGAIMGPHKAIGVLALIVMVWLAVWWRLQSQRPGPIPGTPGWEAFLRRAMHSFLVIATLIMAISGITMSVFHGRAVDVFGWFVIPAQAEVPWLAGMAHEVHEIGGWIMAIAILGHIAVAVKHHRIDHDATFTRMLGRSST